VQVVGVIVRARLLQAQDRCGGDVPTGSALHWLTACPIILRKRRYSGRPAGMQGAIAQHTIVSKARQCHGVVAAASHRLLRLYIN